MPPIMLTVVLILLASGLGAGALADRRPAAAVRLARLGPALGLLLVLGGVLWSWAGDGGAVVGDPLGTVVAAFVLVMACVVAAFADRSLAAAARGPRFFVAANLVVGATVAFSTAEHLAVQAVGWLAVSAATAALIASDGRPQSRAAARRGYGVLVVGDVAVLAAVGLAAGVAGSVGSVESAARAVGERAGLAGVAVGVLLLVGAACRSGLPPFHRWLIGSVEAPTPVSALLHAGVVNGSAVLLVRWFPAYGAAVLVVAAIVTLGILAMVLGVATARTRPDVKGGLAWTTTAQMGFMIVQCGLGLVGPAIVHLAAHGLFKSSLFLGAASQAEHGMGAHPPRRRLRLPLAVSAGVVAAVGVAAALLAVRPAFLGHPAAVLPIGFLWAMAVTALGRSWSGTARVTAATCAGSAALVAVALTATVAVSDLVDGATGLPHTVGSAGAAGLALAGLLAVAVISVAAPALGRRRPRLAAAVWVWLASMPGSGHASWSAWRATRRSTRPEPTGGALSPHSPAADPAREARMAATVRDAASVLAPSFPLERFVAVNPLLQLEDLPSATAVWRAVDELAVRSELDEDDYRRWHRDGRISTDDLRAAAREHLTANGDAADAAAVDDLVDELLHDAPVSLPAPRPVLLSERHDVATGGDRAEVVDELGGWWCARYLSSHLAWRPPGHAEGLWEMWRAAAPNDARPAAHHGGTYRSLLASMPDTPELALAMLLVELGVDRPDHRAYLRRHLVRSRGWASAVVGRSGIDSPDLVAYLVIRLTVEAALMSHGPDRRAASRIPAGWGDEGAQADPAAVARLAVWRAAFERGYRDHLLTQLSTPAAPAAATAAADPAEVVGVFCMDARSEGLRRAFEALGDYETVGYAGFFGLPMSVVDRDASDAVPSCPVIVQPTATYVEAYRPGDAARRARRRRSVEGVAFDAFSITKRSFVGPYATAENAGWVLGARMIGRTVAPMATSRLAAWLRGSGRAARTELRPLESSGWSLEQRAAIAASVLRGMGLAEATPRLIVLCGHESRHLNNLHRAALDCGACGGRSGANNARAAADLLNDPSVRRALGALGITLSDDTYVVAAVHETTTDTIVVPELDEVPHSHAELARQVLHDLRTAGRAVAATRAALLPRSVGRIGVAPDAVARRAADWAQVVPEWGLAGNAALVVGPRALSCGHDLDRRVFLHSYDAGSDPDGSLLSSIMGGPLLVAHWISSQYRASSIDLERLGAGAKPVHNLVGGVGVLEGGGGDLRLGLPAESVGILGRSVHEPMRLLVVIDAPAGRIDAAIAEHEAVRRIADHHWIQVVGRLDDAVDHGWGVRRGPGSWAPWGVDTGDRAVVLVDVDGGVAR